MWAPIFFYLGGGAFRPSNVNSPWQMQIFRKKLDTVNFTTYMLDKY